MFKKSFITIYEIIFFSFFMILSLYCILAYIPFTYINFLNEDFMPIGLKLIYKFHIYIYWLIIISLFIYLKKKVITKIWIFTAMILGVVLIFKSPISNPENNITSFYWAVILQIPVIVLFLAGLVEKLKHIEWQKDYKNDILKTFCASILSAVYVFILYTLIYYFIYNAQAQTIEKIAWFFILPYSAIYYFIIFAFIFVLLTLINSFLDLFDLSPLTGFYIVTGCLITLFYFIIKNMVLSSISFNNNLSVYFSILSSISIVLFLLYYSLKLYPKRPVENTTTLPLCWFSNICYNSIVLNILYLIIVSIFAVICINTFKELDWNFLLKKLSVIFTWFLIFGGFLTLCRRIKYKYNITIVLILVASIAPLSYWGITTGFNTLKKSDKLDIDINKNIEKYSSNEISFKTIYDILSKKINRTKNGDDIFLLIQKNTNIPRDFDIKPRNINFTDNLKQSQYRPDIYIIVIDSFRPDYISSYNPDVNFTPNIKRFSQDSFVFKKAFTRYGATGLSEPAIWAGTIIPHQHYVNPFAPMNTLEKLIKANNYRQLISIDNVLIRILKKDSHIINLLSEKDREYSLENMLNIIMEKLKNNINPTEPVFEYIQPQDIHISVINKAGKNIVMPGDYGKFYAPYASRIKSMDKNFGEFINFLKKSGRYDNSIIILTSDHGDALGEGGRWGHAYTVFPEILRVPLIIHIPDKLKNRYKTDVNRAVFLTDISPTLYKLLGYEINIIDDNILGIPVFNKDTKHLKEREKDTFMVVSSYGPVYGLLMNAGKSLYIIDGVNYKEYYYKNIDFMDNIINNEVSMKMRNSLRKKVNDLSKFYNFKR